MKTDRQSTQSDAPKKIAVSDNFLKMPKCTQKLCQRTKNLGSDGVCNVCQDVIKNTEAKHRIVVEKRRFSKRVEIDIKKMVEVNEKLSKGIKVDPDVVSNLLLNGIINIIDQNESLEKLEEKIEQLQHSDISTKARLESLESWVIRQGDSINQLDEQLGVMDKTGAIVKETKDIKELKGKMSKLENDVQHVKLSFPKKNAVEAEKKVIQPMKCKECAHGNFS